MRVIWDKKTFELTASLDLEIESQQNHGFRGEL